METVILQTKLYIPPTRPVIVPRPRLIEQLNKGLHHKLTLISAPAGFGKTTLLSEWIAQTKLSIAWVSLDESDNDSTHFLAYFIAALQRINPKFGHTVQDILQSPHLPPFETLMTMLINEISASPTDIHYIFVLDDYHLIHTQTIHNGLTFLLDHLPSQMHLIIATREDPHLSLTQLRVQGQLVELRATELRFTSPEVTKFLNQVMGLNLSLEDITTLETRTEGWIAGLQLAAISIQGHEDSTSLIKNFTGSHHFILDYLIEEVFQQQPENIQLFLLYTSILNRLCSALCDAMLTEEAISSWSYQPATTSHEILEHLEQANLFIIPLDAERQWYRYHHLFADLLYQQLILTQPEQLPTLHRRASDWFATQGLNREALHHAIEAKDYHRAADLIEILVQDVLQTGNHTIISSWINALPETIIKQRPYLCVYHAWALKLTGEFDAVEARLSDAEAALTNEYQKDSANTKAIRGYIFAHRVYLVFLKGDHVRTITFAHQALELLPPQATVMRTETALFLGAVYRWLGNIQAAIDIIAEATAIDQKTGINYTTILNFFNLAEIYVEQTRLHQAMDLYKQTFQWAEQYMKYPNMPFIGYGYVGVGIILRQWNKVEEAYQYITKGIALCQEWNTAEITALSYIELAHTHRALGNDNQARFALQEAKQIFDDFSPWGSNVTTAYLIQLELAHGKSTIAEEWIQSNQLDINNEIKPYQELEYLTLARVFIAQNQFEKALLLLERLYQVIEAIGRTASTLEILILQALALSAQGQLEPALTKLEQALAIGEPENYLRIFIDEGPPMAQLLYKAANYGIFPNYARRLLTLFPTTEVDDTNPQKIQSHRFETIEPLSERELQVVELIAKGLTNREIATQLCLTLNTIKAHTRNIYGKLGVNSRTQAVAKAKTLGILSRLG